LAANKKGKGQLMLLKKWNKGKYNFWIVGIGYMRRRDAVIQRFFELQGKTKENARIVKLLEAWVADDNADFDDTMKAIKGEKK